MDISRILDVPAIPQLEILRFLYHKQNVIDLFRLAAKTPKVADLTRLKRFQVDGMTLFGNAQGDFYLHVWTVDGDIDWLPESKISLRIFILADPHGNTNFINAFRGKETLKTEAVIGNGVRIDEVYRDPKKCCWFANSGGDVSRTVSMTLDIVRFCADVFRCKEFSVCVDAPQFFAYSVWHHFAEFLTGTVSIQNSVFYVPPEQMTFLLESVNAQNLVLECVPVHFFTYSKPFKATNLTIKHAFWVRFESILHMDCVRLVIENSGKPHAEQMNAFIRKWQSSEGLQNLEFLSIGVSRCFPKPYWNRMLKGTGATERNDTSKTACVLRQADGRQMDVELMRKEIRIVVKKT